MKFIVYYKKFNGEISQCMGSPNYVKVNGKINIDLLIDKMADGKIAVHHQADYFAIHEGFSARDEKKVTDYYNVPKK